MLVTILQMQDSRPHYNSYPSISRAKGKGPLDCTHRRSTLEQIQDNLVPSSGPPNTHSIRTYIQANTSMHKVEINKSLYNEPNGEPHTGADFDIDLSYDVEQVLRATAFSPDAVWDPDWMMLWFLLVPVL